MTHFSSKHAITHSLPIFLLITHVYTHKWVRKCVKLCVRGTQKVYPFCFSKKMGRTSLGTKFSWLTTTLFIYDFFLHFMIDGFDSLVMIGAKHPDDLSSSPSVVIVICKKFRLTNLRKVIIGESALCSNDPKFERRLSGASWPTFHKSNDAKTFLISILKALESLKTLRSS